MWTTRKFTVVTQKKDYSAYCCLWKWLFSENDMKTHKYILRKNSELLTLGQLIRKTTWITSKNNLLFVHKTFIYDRYVDFPVLSALSSKPRDRRPLHLRPDAARCTYFKTDSTDKSMVFFLDFTTDKHGIFCLTFRKCWIWAVTLVSNSINMPVRCSVWTLKQFTTQIEPREIFFVTFDWSQ